jgi:hypothetical protein
VLVVAPYAATVPLAFAASDRLEPSAATGVMALAVAPGALFAPAVVSAAGGQRSDMAGALLLGTVVLSVVLVATEPAMGTAGLVAAQAFLIGSLVAGAMPTVRDRLAMPLRWGARLAALAVLALAVAGRPDIDASTVMLSLVAVTLTLVTASAVALALRRDVLSAAAAAGTRDPILAIALAWSTGGSSATAVPVVSAVILGTVAAAVIVRRR